MRAASAPKPSAERLGRPSQLVVILAVGGMLLALGACAKGGTKASKTPTPTKTASPAAATIPTYQVSVSKFTYQGMPATVPANKPFNIVFSNKESFPITHELVVLGLTSGKTVQDVIADAKKKGQAGEDDWLHFGEIADIDTGGTGAHTYDLPPGNYVITCWENGKAGGGTGPVHASIGMAKTFTAS